MYLYMQEKAILETRPVLRKAIEEVYTSISASPRTLVIADLGCASGPKTLCFVSEVMSMVRTCSMKKSKDAASATEVQFFLNDLSGNDFNLLFWSLELCDSIGSEKETPSYYGRLLSGL
jgi:jasmonate O-methyltransferase